MTLTYARPAALALALTLLVPAHAAEPTLTDSLRADVDACTDFYEYANGKWLATTAIPPDRASWGAFNELDKRTKADLRDILDAAARDPSLKLESAERKVAEFYRSGTDTAAIERAGTAPLSPEFARIDAMRTNRDLMDELARLHRMDVNAGFELTFTIDAQDSTRYLVELYQAGLGLPDRDYYFRADERSASQRAAYVKHVARMFELLGDAPDAAAKQAGIVMRLETQLANASMTTEQRRDPKAVHNKTAVSDLPRLAGGIDWDRYLRLVGVGDRKEINVAQPAFFKAFADAVQTVPMEDWKTYLRWQLVHATASKLSSPFENENFAFYGTLLTGRKALQPREERVVDTITGRFGNAPLAMAAGELYVAKRFSPEAKARALALVENMKAVLRERIAELDWMSDATRKAALHKLDAMVVKIGYPDRWRDYAALELDSPSYVGKWLAANAFEMDRQIALTKKPVDRTEWFSSPHTVNAFYSPQMNAIVFPAGILQPPFFDPARDDAANYGGIGMVIGHEITHGFDDKGRQFDAQGNLHDWWTAQDAERYVSRADRVAKQYGDYVGVEGLKVNGKLTLGENIADIGGLKIAYLALQRALKRRPQAPVEGFTPDQRFFIAFAQVWRNKMRPEFERLLINTDPHSPARFRVRGPLANMSEFAGAFSCRNIDTMLRAEDERAAIW